MCCPSKTKFRMKVEQLRDLEKIVDASVTHLGDNLSRHSPIVLKLQVPASKNDLVCKPSNRRPAWYKANGDVKNFYHDKLLQRLSASHTPISIACRNTERCSPQQQIQWHTSSEKGKQVRVFWIVFYFSFRSITVSFCSPLFHV